jgi:glycosyltransferase involved in cell wall biosynthesis
MAFISVVAPCYNEEANIAELYRRLKDVFAQLPQHYFEIIFIDNCSEDHTVARIKEIAAQDPQVKLIVNARNFGHVRSPVYGMMQAYGDAVILMATDLQDPPELLLDFVKQWEEGYRIVVAVKDGVEESKLFHALRGFYYRFLASISEGEVIEHFTGFGLYDQSVINVLRETNEPYPYLRGIITELGFKIAKVPFFKPMRKRGLSKNNLYTLYDMAMLGITSHSRLPLRFAIFAGFGFGFIGMLLALFYLVLKLLYWQAFSMGQAPMLIGLLMFCSIQLFFIGLLGEYILAINARTQKRPLVIESERVNFVSARDGGGE